MTVFEFVKTHRSVLEQMSSISVNPKDCRYIDLYDDYVRLQAEGHKTTYIMQYLADEYNVDERTIYRVVNKFANEARI